MLTYCSLKCFEYCFEKTFTSKDVLSFGMDFFKDLKYLKVNRLVKPTSTPDFNKEVNLFSVLYIDSRLTSSSVKNNP